MFWMGSWSAFTHWLHVTSFQISKSVHFISFLLAELGALSPIGRTSWSENRTKSSTSRGCWVALLKTKKLLLKSCSINRQLALYLSSPHFAGVNYFNLVQHVLMDLRQTPSALPSQPSRSIDHATAGNANIPPSQQLRNIEHACVHAHRTLTSPATRQPQQLRSIDHAIKNSSELPRLLDDGSKNRRMNSIKKKTPRWSKTVRLWFSSFCYSTYLFNIPNKPGVRKVLRRSSQPQRVSSEPSKMQKQHFDKARFCKATKRFFITFFFARMFCSRMSRRLGEIQLRTQPRKGKKECIWYIYIYIIYICISVYDFICT